MRVLYYVLKVFTPVSEVFRMLLLLEGIGVVGNTGFKVKLQPRLIKSMYATKFCVRCQTVAQAQSPFI